MKFKDILLIDNDEDDQEIFCSILSSVSPETRCVTFYLAQEALDYLNETDTLPEAIFSDLYMPLMNGVDFLELIKSNGRLKEIPVFIYSAFSDYDISELQDLGAAGLVRKTTSYNELENALKNVLLN